MSHNMIEVFEAQRDKLIGLAYRITGSIVEAEDIVQETYLKWAAADHTNIESPYSWLMTVATRMSLDHLKSAKMKRESYIGPWLPEPFVIDNEVPENQYELDESITMALLVLLERLNPGERASFILHDLFHFNFNEVANILEKTDASCRKLASRAREKIEVGTTRETPSKEEHVEIVSAFMGAVKKGEVNELVSLLRDNVILHVDGGGKVKAALKILEGKETVSTFLMNVVAPSFAVTDAGDVAITHVWFNGAPGFVVWLDAQPTTAFNFEVVEHKIRKIHALRNPDKLKLFENSLMQ